MTETNGITPPAFPQIFLSYSRTDWPLAKPILDALEAQGFTVWWDGLLEAGTLFTHTTESALENASAVVVLWSKTSVDSHWVRDEAQSGRDRRRLVPLTLDGTMPPLGFRQFQCIDISPARGDASHPAMQNAFQAIRQLIDPDTKAASLAATIPQKPAAPSRRKFLIGGGAIAALGLAGAGVWQSGLLVNGSGVTSLAILPFKNLSGDPEKEYFSEGLSEELRAALGQNEGLRVSAQASSSKAEQEAGEPVDIAKKLGVAYLLTGSVRLIDGELRISTQLINGKTGFDEWSETYDRTLADVFAVQTDIAQRVANALAVAIPTLTGNAPSRVGSTNNPAALDAYLRGRALYDLAADEETDRAALMQFEAAIAADPKYAVAWAAKSRVLTAIANAYSTDDQTSRLYDQAIGAARKAIELEPKLADGHAALGFVLLNGRLDVAGAAIPYTKAREFGGANADVLQAYATYSARTGNFSEARGAIERATELDPLNPDVLRTRGMIEYTAGDYPAARTAIAAALKSNPEMSAAHGWLGDIALLEGDASAALALYQKEPSRLSQLRGIAIAQRALGNQAEAEKSLARLDTEFGTNALYQEAQTFSQWGETERALDALDAAYAAGDSGLVLALNDPLLVPLRKHPRFIALLGKIGFR